MFENWRCPFPSLPKSPKYLVSRCLEPLKAEPQEMFVGPNTYSQGIWKTRVCSGKWVANHVRWFSSHPGESVAVGRFFLINEILTNPLDSCMVRIFLPTFTFKKHPNVGTYIPYMDPIGNNVVHCFLKYLYVPGGVASVGFLKHRQDQIYDPIWYQAKALTKRTRIIHVFSMKVGIYEPNLQSRNKIDYSWYRIPRNWSVWSNLLSLESDS